MGSQVGRTTRRGDGCAQDSGESHAEFAGLLPQRRAHVGLAADVGAGIPDDNRAPDLAVLADARREHHNGCRASASGLGWDRIPIRLHRSFNSEASIVVVGFGVSALDLGFRCWAFRRVNFVAQIDCYVLCCLATLHSGLGCTSASLLGTFGLCTRPTLSGKSSPS